MANPDKEKAKNKPQQKLTDNMVNSEEEIQIDSILKKVEKTDSLKEATNHGLKVNEKRVEEHKKKSKIQ